MKAQFDKLAIEDDPDKTIMIQIYIEMELTETLGLSEEEHLLMIDPDPTQLTDETILEIFLTDFPEESEAILSWTSTDLDTLAELWDTLFPYLESENFAELIPEGQPQKQLEQMLRGLVEEGPRFDMQKCHVCAQPSHSVCARCERINYCSVTCQRKDWIQHKNICYQQDQN